MKRRIVLALLLMSVALSGAILAQDGAPKTPPDRITVEELKAIRADNKILVLDVRASPATKIKGAAYIPIDQLEMRLAELPRDRVIVTYCS
jgi:hypothetical protein